MNRIAISLVTLALVSAGSVFAQQTNQWQTNVGGRDAATAPRRDITPIGSRGIAPTPLGKLSTDSGQVWKEYDIRSFTRRLRDQQKPEQTIVDWILRETGTNTWFGEPMSMLTANRNAVRVYHTPQVQAVVKEVIDRFLNSRSEANEVAVRLVTVENPDWRVRALPMLTPVQSQTPGIEAWVLSRENAAMLLYALNQRVDYREHNSPNLTIYSGQTHTIESTRPRIFNSGMDPTNAQFGVAGLAQVDEGFSLQISPLVGRSGDTIEAVIKCSVDQIEKFTPLNVGRVDQFGTYKRSQLKVPQVSSWHLHERFRWPTNEVLLISRGLVATPGPAAAKGTIRRIFDGKAPRAEALLFLESRHEIKSASGVTTTASRTDSANYRGRY